MSFLRSTTLIKPSASIGREIARMEPAAAERLGRLLLVLVVAGHQMRRAMHDLADLAGLTSRIALVDDARLDIEHGPAAGAGLAQLVLGAEHGGERRDLRLAVEVPEAHLRHAARHFAHDLDRHDRGAVIAFAQARRSAASKPGERSIEIQTVGGAKNEVARSRSMRRKMLSGTGLAVTILTPPA